MREYLEGNASCSAYRWTVAILCRKFQEEVEEDPAPWQGFLTWWRQNEGNLERYWEYIVVYCNILAVGENKLLPIAIFSLILRILQERAIFSSIVRILPFFAIFSSIMRIYYYCLVQYVLPWLVRSLQYIAVFSSLVTFPREAQVYGNWMKVIN